MKRLMLEDLVPGIPVPGGAVFKAREVHTCKPPEARKFDIGDVFVCGACNREFELVDRQQYEGGPFWQRRT